MSLVYAEIPGPASDAPILILLHGYGADEQDLLALGAELSRDWHVYAVRAPISLGIGGFGWFGIDWLPDGTKVLDLDGARTVAEELSAFLLAKMDPQRPKFIVGFSQGAMMTLALAGGLDESYIGFGVLSGARLPFIQPFGGVRSFLVQHGTEDVVVPCREGDLAAQWLAESGHKVEHLRYAMGHGISGQSFRDLDRWLNQVVDENSPSSVE